MKRRELSNVPQHFQYDIILSSHAITIGTITIGICSGERGEKRGEWGRSFFTSSLTAKQLQSSMNICATRDTDLFILMLHDQMLIQDSSRQCGRTLSPCSCLLFSHNDTQNSSFQSFASAYITYFGLTLFSTQVGFGLFHHGSSSGQSQICSMRNLLKGRQGIPKICVSSLFRYIFVFFSLHILLEENLLTYHDMYQCFSPAISLNSSHLL